MHRYFVSEPIRERLLRRQGKLSSHDTIDAARTALVVVDMQNHFVAEGFPAEVPISREIVPNINRLAKAMRAAGGSSFGSRQRRPAAWSTGATTTATC
jgi:ureidoacrylate peracid hydrolase